MSAARLGAPFDGRWSPAIGMAEAMSKPSQARNPTRTVDGDGNIVPADVTILVVEDEPLVLEVMAETLREHGLRVVACDDADAGLAALPLIGGPTVLVTEVRLRSLSGPALAQAFRAEHPGGAVVFMTGLAHGGFVPGVVGVRDVLLRKPFGGDDLREAVSRAVALLPTGAAAKVRPFGTVRAAAARPSRVSRGSHSDASGE
jgi:FixJ family two-component response regulator